MDSGKRIWTWAGVLLAVVCAVVGAARILLFQSAMDSMSPNVDPASLELISASPNLQKNIGPNFLQKHSAASTLQGAPPSGQVQPHKDVQLPLKQESSEGQTAQNEAVDLIRPLGIVEKPGGRIQAVIPDGEWTRLVEVGEVLADNSKVMRVSSEEVAILRSPSSVPLELARDRGPNQNFDGDGGSAWQEASSSAATSKLPAPSALPEPKQVGPAVASTRKDAELPGFQTGEAAYYAPSPRPQLLRTEALASDLRLAGSSSSLQASGSDKGDGRIGSVELTNGKVQSVFADGPWVKLLPAESPSGKVMDNAWATQSSPTPIGSERPAALTGYIYRVDLPAPNSAAEPRRESSSSRIQNLVASTSGISEPIGIVQWANGNTSAVLIEGNSVTFSADNQTVATTRRALATMSQPAGEENVPDRIKAPESAWLSEDQAARLLPPGEDPVTRGPPAEHGTPETPQDVARGQPEDSKLIDASRAPPTGFANAFGTMIDALPVGESASLSRTELLHSIRDLPSNLLGAPRPSPPRSVSEIGSGIVEETDFADSTATVAPKSIGNDKRVSPVVAPSAASEILGVIQFADGSERSIVHDGESVLILEDAGRSNDDLHKPEKGRISSGNSSETPTASIGGTEGNRAGAATVVLQSSGRMLQSKQGIRDNRRQWH